MRNLLILIALIYSTNVYADYVNTYECQIYKTACSTSEPIYSAGYSQVTTRSVDGIQYATVSGDDYYNNADPYHAQITCDYNTFCIYRNDDIAKCKHVAMDSWRSYRADTPLPCPSGNPVTEGLTTEHDCGTCDPGKKMICGRCQDCPTGYVLGLNNAEGCTQHCLPYCPHGHPEYGPVGTSLNGSPDCVQPPCGPCENLHNGICYSNAVAGQQFNESDGSCGPCPGDQAINPATGKCEPLCPDGQPKNAKGECDPCPYMMVNGICQCPGGKTRDMNGQCECPGGMPRNPDGSCPDCPSGLVINGQCVEKEDPKNCNNKTCPQGYILTPAPACECVKDPKEGKPGDPGTPTDPNNPQAGSGTGGTDAGKDADGEDAHDGDDPDDKGEGQKTGRTGYWGGQEGHVNQDAKWDDEKKEIDWQPLRDAISGEGAGNKVSDGITRYGQIMGKFHGEGSAPRIEFEVWNQRLDIDLSMFDPLAQTMRTIFGIIIVLSTIWFVYKMWVR